MPQILWSQSVEGERPDLLLGESRILLHVAATGDRRPATEALCYDLLGSLRWSRPGWAGLLALPGDRFLVSTPEGNPQVVNSDGEVLHRGTLGSPERVTRHGQTLLLANDEQVWATDLELRCLWQATWPGPPRPTIDCFVEGTFYWVAENRAYLECVRTEPCGVCGKDSPAAWDF